MKAKAAAPVKGAFIEKMKAEAAAPVRSAAMKAMKAKAAALVKGAATLEPIGLQGSFALTGEAARVAKQGSEEERLQQRSEEMKTEDKSAGVCG